MDELIKKWTMAWHGIMDEELGPEPNANVEKRYAESDRDFRLHFDFWSLSDIGKRICLEMLPLGDQVAARILDNEHAWETNMIISEAKAEDMFRTAIRDLSIFVDLDVSPNDPIKILHAREDKLETLEAESFIDPWLTREVWRELIDNAPEEHRKAYQFISETLYQATTYYEGIFHALWPYIDAPAGVDPFANILRMNRSEIKWLKTQNGLMIFYNQDATINDGANIEVHLSGYGLHDISDQIVKWVAEREMHHMKRGFPAERLKFGKVGVSGSKPYQIVLRDVDNPDLAIEDELPYIGWQEVWDGVLYVKHGYGVFIEGQKKGPHTQKIKIHTHYKNGKSQREKPYP